MPALREDEVIERLGQPNNALRAFRMPGEESPPALPGLYSWWGDEEARSVVADAVGSAVGPLIYIGQAGAGRSTATLASRILRNHISGTFARSTFRRTLAAVLLAARRASDPQAPIPTETEVTAWIRSHLAVVAVPVTDRGALLTLEAAALRAYDPPLNLMGMPRSEARQRLSAHRAALAN